MDPYVIALIVILVLALLFFGYSQFSARSATGSAVSTPSVSSQYVGGGCGV